MKLMPPASLTSFNNILYIGDEAGDCLEIIKKFNDTLLQIEQRYAGWHRSNNALADDKLQHHIQYHFEGGIAIFKFKNEDEIPLVIRKECLMAAKNLAFEQLSYAS
jgi:hypothetical protein